MNLKKLSPITIIFTIIILALLWYFRPFFHSFMMSFVVSPLRLIFFLIIILGLISLFRSMGKLRLVQTGPANWTIKSGKGLSGKTVAVYFILLIIVIFGLAIENEARYYVASKTINYQKRADLPDFNPIRLTPKQVAARYAADTFQSPQETLGDSQIVMEKDKLVRVFPRIPDGGLLYLINKMSGFVTVEVDTLDRKVAIDNQDFKYSEGVGITDNIYFQLAKKKYFVTYSSQPIYLKDDQNKWITVVPYMSYKGFPFRVPEWAGVMIVRSNGDIQDLTTEQAQKIPYLKNNRIYPKELSSYYAQSYAYKDGLINKWFLHKNQTEVVALPGSESVIHAPTSEGFKEIVVAEPYGRSYGIYKIFLFDGTTGKREIIEYDQNSQLTGPIAAADYIKKSFPTYNWNNFTLAEPRPVKVNGDLNWLMSIIPNDSAGIATTVLLDAKTNKVTEVKTEADLKSILAGAPVATPTAPANPAAPTADKNAEIQAKIDAIQTQLNDLKNLVNQK